MVGFDIDCKVLVETLTQAIEYVGNNTLCEMEYICFQHSKKKLYVYALNGYEMFEKVCYNIKGKLVSDNMLFSTNQAKDLIKKLSGKKDTVRLTVEFGERDREVEGTYKLLDSGESGSFTCTQFVKRKFDFPSIVSEGWEGMNISEIPPAGIHFKYDFITKLAKVFKTMPGGQITLMLDKPEYKKSRLTPEDKDTVRCLRITAKDDNCKIVVRFIGDKVNALKIDEDEQIESEGE